MVDFWERGSEEDVDMVDLISVMCSFLKLCVVQV